MFTNPLFAGIPGGPEMIIVLLIVVLLFGANKLPKLARSSGQAIGEFSRGRTEVENELQSARSDAKATLDTEAPFESSTQETERPSPNE